MRIVKLVVFSCLFSMGFAATATAQDAPLSPDEQVVLCLKDCGSADARVREKALAKLGELWPDLHYQSVLARSTPQLLPLLKDSDLKVRLAATKTLGLIGGLQDFLFPPKEQPQPFIIAALINGLADQQQEVRLASAVAIVHITRVAPRMSIGDFKLPQLFEQALEPLNKAAEKDEQLQSFAKAAAIALGQSKDLPAPDMNRSRYLLLDSRIIESTDNARLTVGRAVKDKNNPLFSEGKKPWERHYNNPYLSIMYDEEDQLYKLWQALLIKAGPTGKSVGEELPADQRAFHNWAPGKRVGGLCYATSKDGIKWDKPKLGVVDFNGSKDNNIVLVSPRDNNSICVLKDLQEKDPKQRYKALLPMKRKSVAWFSPDGIHWGPQQSAGNIAHGDTLQSIWWDKKIKKYVLITRRWGGAKTGGYYGGFGHRRAARGESSDFLNWSRPEIVIAGLDTRMQVHDMTVVPYAGIYLGLVGLFDINADQQWCELAWSPDSHHWYRINPGKALIPNSRVMGDCDWGCIFPSSPIFKKDEVLLYYGGTDGGFMGFRSGSLCLAHLRKDGFAGYEETNRRGPPAKLTTKPLTVVGETLLINADVPPSGGFVKTRVLAETGEEVLAVAELKSKSVTDEPLEWLQGSLKALKSKKVRIEFEMRDAKVYSFSFE